MKCQAIDYYTRKCENEAVEGEDYCSKHIGEIIQKPWIKKFWEYARGKKEHLLMKATEGVFTGFALKVLDWMSDEMKDFFKAKNVEFQLIDEKGEDVYVEYVFEKDQFKKMEKERFNYSLIMKNENEAITLARFNERDLDYDITLIEFWTNGYLNIKNKQKCKRQIGFLYRYYATYKCIGSVRNGNRRGGEMIDNLYKIFQLL